MMPRTTPVSAPSIVPISSRITSLKFVRRFSIALAALAQEVAMTEIRLAPDGVRHFDAEDQGQCGDDEDPAAIPITPPSVPAATDIRQTNAGNSTPLISIAVPLDRLLLQGEWTSRRERSAVDQRRQVLLDLKVKRDGALRVSLHTDIMNSG
jgi:hypothetical protein